MHEPEFGSRLRLRLQTGRWQTICYKRRVRTAGAEPVYCNYCRSLNPDDSVYCRACGRTIKLSVEQFEGPIYEGKANDTRESLTPEILDSASVAGPHAVEAFHRDYADMDDEEMGQLQEAYEKLRVPLPKSLHRELELRALTKQVEELERQPGIVSDAGTGDSDRPSESFETVADAEANPFGDNERFADRDGQPMPPQKKKARWGAYLGSGAITVVGIALFAVGAVFIYGLVWVSAKLYPIVEMLSLLGLIAFPICLILSIFRKVRRRCGHGVVWVSRLWGAGLWMYSIVTLYDLWGLVGIYVGFFTLGYVTIPLTCVALLFKGQFGLLGQIVLWFVIVISTRMLGYWIVSKSQEEAI